MNKLNHILFIRDIKIIFKTRREGSFQCYQSFALELSKRRVSSESVGSQNRDGPLSSRVIKKSRVIAVPIEFLRDAEMRRALFLCRPCGLLAPLSSGQSLLPGIANMVRGKADYATCILKRRIEKTRTLRAML